MKSSRGAKTSGKNGGEEEEEEDSIHACMQTRTHTLSLSFHSEPAGLLNGRQQLVVEFVVALIRWNVNPVETVGWEEETCHSSVNIDCMCVFVCLCVCVCVYQVCALGRLLVLASIWWMVKSLGPAAPADRNRSMKVEVTWPPGSSRPFSPLTLEGLEALQRHPGGTGDKLQ